MRKLNKLNKTGFTLTEMLVVIAILVILASVLAINVGKYLAQSTATSDKVDGQVTQMKNSNASKIGDLQNYGFVDGKKQSTSVGG